MKKLSLILSLLIAQCPCVLWAMHISQPLARSASSSNLSAHQKSLTDHRTQLQNAELQKYTHRIQTLQKEKHVSINTEAVNLQEVDQKRMEHNAAFEQQRKAAQKLIGQYKDYYEISTPPSPLDRLILDLEILKKITADTELSQNLALVRTDMVKEIAKRTAMKEIHGLHRQGETCTCHTTHQLQNISRIVG